MTDKVTVLGGSLDPRMIGGQRLLIQTCGKTALYDSGISLEETESGGVKRVGLSPELISYLQEKKIVVHVIFVSHSHEDHVGAILDLEKTGLLHPDAKLLCTPQCAQLMNVVWRDSIRHGSSFGMFQWAKIQSRIQIIERPGPVEVFPGYVIYAIPNGHIPGSCSYLIPLSDGGYGILTGDWCIHDQPIVQGACFLDWPPGVPTPRVILSNDCTLSESKEEPEPYSVRQRQLVDIVRKSLKKKKKIVIGGFAQGKIQNTAATLSAAGISCYIDSPMAIKVCDILSQTTWSDRDIPFPPFGDESGIYPVQGPKHRRELIESNEGWVVLTTSGVGDTGPILDYYQAGLSSSRYIFITTNYLFEGKPAFLIRQVAEKYPTYRGHAKERKVTYTDKDGTVYKDVPLRATVYHIGLGSHSTLTDSLNVTSHLAQQNGGALDLIICNHGTIGSLEKGRVILRPFAKRVDIASPPGREIEI